MLQGFPRPILFNPPPLPQVIHKNYYFGNSLAVQWLRLHASIAGGTAGSIPGWGTKILHAMRRGQKKKKNCLFYEYSRFLLSRLKSHISPLGSP